MSEQAQAEGGAGGATLPPEVALAAPLPAGVDPTPWLIPHLGRPVWPEGDPRQGAFDRYLASAAVHPRLIPRERARWLALPWDWSSVLDRPALLAESLALDELAGAEGRHLIVFFWHDDSRELPLRHALVLRTSLLRGARYHRSEFTAPSFLADLGPPGPVRVFDPTPTVAFCGDVGPALPAWRRVLRRAKRELRGLAARALPAIRPRSPGEEPYALRREALRRLERARGLRTRFVRRRGFFAGSADVVRGAWDAVSVTRARAEYRQNLLAADYVLCVRGTGNYSHRLFETLSMGRIPVLIDTNGGLPFDFLVEWSRQMVVVPVDRLCELPAAVCAFHRELGPRGFERVQRENRALWERWLTPEAFFGRMQLHLDAARVPPAR